MKLYVLLLWLLVAWVWLFASQDLVLSSWIDGDSSMSPKNGQKMDHFASALNAYSSILVGSRFFVILFCLWPLLRTRPPSKDFELGAGNECRKRAGVHYGKERLSDRWSFIKSLCYLCRWNRSGRFTEAIICSAKTSSLVSSATCRLWSIPQVLSCSPLYPYGLNYFV